MVKNIQHRKKLDRDFSLRENETFWEIIVSSYLTFEKVVRLLVNLTAKSHSRYQEDASLQHVLYDYNRFFLEMMEISYYLNGCYKIKEFV